MVSALFFVLLLTGVASTFLYARDAHAAVNSTINFQARILQANGAVVPDGSLSVEFKIYDAASGGTNEWTETQSLPAKNGYITASLGAVTAFPGTIDWSQEHWITMNINSDGEMGPSRMKITSVPYAFRSGQSDLLTNGSGTLSAADLLQLSPGTIQTTNSANTALRFNQQGIGNLIQLQSAGVDRFTVSNGGDVTAAGGLTIGNSTSTTAGTIRWNGSIFEGFDGINWNPLGGGDTPTINRVKLADEVQNIGNNATATLQNDDELFFNIAAGETWTFRFIVQGNSNAAPDYKFAVTAPGGAACKVGYSAPQGGTSISNLGCGVSTGLVTGNTANDLYEIVGTVTNGGTAGAVTLQWAQNTANAANSTIYSGSSVFASRVTGSSTTTVNFIQGGNSFTAGAILGTNDAFDLNLITSGVSRLSVTAAGAVGITNALTVGTGVTITSGGLTVTNGGATITGNILQTGAGTFGTGTGAVSLNGATSVTGTNTLTVGTGATTLGGSLGVTGITTLTGLLNANGGLTVAGVTNINNNANNTTNVNTGTSTGTVTIGGGTAPLVINSTNFDVTAGGALSGITGYAQASGNFGIVGTGTFSTGTGLVALNGNTTVTGTFGVTSTGSYTGLLSANGGIAASGAASSINNNSNFATNINTGTSNGTITLGGGTAPLVINSTNFDVTAGGALSGITGLALASGNISQVGTGTFSTGTGLVALNGNTTVTGTLAVTSTGSYTGLLSANGGATIRGLTVNTATVTDDQLLVAAAAGGLARFNGTITSVDLTGTRTYTLPDASGTFQLTPASGSYLVQVPTSTAANTISPATNGVVGLTVNANSTNAVTAAIINQGLAADGLQINTTNAAGTQTNGLLVSRNGAGTTTNLLNLTNTAGTATNGLAFTGTYTNLITSINFSVANSGALVAVGINSGTGLVQGTGGLTILGASNLNNNGNFATNVNTGTSTGTVTIGGGTSPLVINSTNFDVTAGGALSGITGYAQASGNFGIVGVGTFSTGTGTVALNGNTTVTGTLTVSAATALNGGLTIGDAAADALTITSSAITTPNGLNFDANTLVLDAANNRVGIGVAAPANQFSINTPTTADATPRALIATGAAANKGLVIQANAGQTASILELQRSTGVALATFSSTGQLTLGSDNAASQAGLLTLNDATGANGFTSVLGTTALTATRAINLPDEAGTICIRNSALCGFLTLGPAAVQTDATTNPSIFINKTGATGNILTLQDAGVTVFSVLNNGALAIQTTATNALNIKNTAGTDFFNVDTSGALVQIGSATADAIATLLVLDTKNTAGDPTGVNGGSYYNSVTGKMRCYEGSVWKDCVSETTITKATTQTVTNSAAFTNDTALLLAMVANATYNFTATINYDTTSAAGDFKYTFTIPAGAVVYVNALGPSGAAANTVCNISASGQTCAIDVAAAFRGTITLNGYVTTTGTAGNLQFQFAQNTATPGQSVNIYLGSTVTYKRTL